MALNTSGPISIGGATVGQSVNLELKLAATATSSLGDAAFRGLAKVPSGAISLNNFYGKSSIIDIAITTNSANYVLNPAVVPGYVAGQTAVQVTISAGVYVYSTNTTNAALTVSGFIAGDQVTIVNNGYIIGKGGNGASGVSWAYPNAVFTPAGAGGPGISLAYGVTVINNSYIAGGGGGGGCAIIPNNRWGSGGGGGAGGGNGGSLRISASLTLNGGAGGGLGLSGSNGVGLNDGGLYQGSGGGGGRILPGVGGLGGIGFLSFSTTAVPGKGGGSGGGGGGWWDDAASAGDNGGNGGSAGAVGQTGFFPQFNEGAASGGGGGGWGAAGGASPKGGAPGYPNVAGGIGGNAIKLNGNTVIVPVTGTMYGAIS